MHKSTSAMILCGILCLLALSCSHNIRYTSLVDPFWGTGATDSPLSEGMARGWNWEKAQSGNTTPAAVLPYGWMSVCPFTGGYSSGYGSVGYSSGKEPPIINPVPKAYGITHLHHTGVGLIEKFYNYLMIIPYVEGSDISRASAMEGESAHPGYFAASLPDYGVSFELTARQCAAIHRWEFTGGQAFLKLDAAHLGLGTECFLPRRNDMKPEQVEACSLKAVDASNWTGTVRTYGVDVHFALSLDADAVASQMTDSTLTLSLAGKKATSALGLSLISEDEALERSREAIAAGFDSSAASADNAWEEALGGIRAKFSDPALTGRFYSTLYHSMTKPCECEPGRLIDLSTFWDVYHTALPLMMASNPSMATLLADHILHTVDSLGFSPICQIIDSKVVEKDKQCTTIPVYSLCDAYFRGAITDYPAVKAALLKEYSHADIEGMSPSHALDLAGAYRAGAFVADFAADKAFADSLLALSHVWRTVYDESTGLLIKDAKYYEGNHYNYSFRPHAGMNERVELAGGTGRYLSLLDEFFRVGDDCPEWDADFDRIRRPNYFEGLNNEADMDTPFAYIWCGRTDRLAEVIDAVRRYRFTDGEGGCPGNNDSGGTSSWYVWNCLGLYPLAGAPYYLLGSPSVDSAQFDFAGGTLEIEVERESAESIYPVNYSFNGVDFDEPWIKVSDLEKGGRLVFRLADHPSTTPAPIPDWL